MFRNIGRKIKKLALVLFWISLVIGVLGSLITGIVMIATAGRWSPGMVFAGIGIIIFGSGITFLFSWIGSFFMYGYGQLIDDTEINRKTNQELLKRMGGSVRGSDPMNGIPQYENSYAAPTSYSAPEPIQPVSYAAPAQDKPWYCPRCGAKNTDGKFCYRCGTPNE